MNNYELIFKMVTEAIQEYGPDFLPEIQRTSKLIDDLSFDSLALVNLQVGLEDQFDFMFDPISDDFDKIFDTVDSICNYIQKKQTNISQM